MGKSDTHIKIVICDKQNMHNFIFLIDDPEFVNESRKFGQKMRIIKLFSLDKFVSLYLVSSTIY